MIKWEKCVCVFYTSSVGQKIFLHKVMVHIASVNVNYGAQDSFS